MASGGPLVSDGRYLAYPEYKESGSPWFGQIPTHWTVDHAKWHIAQNDGGVWGSDPDGISDTIVLRSTEQTVDGYWSVDDPAKRKLAPADRSSATLEKDDLLITKASGSSLHIGKTTIVDEEIARLHCCYSNFTQRVKLKVTLLPKLCWYIFNNELARRQFDFLSSSTTGLANLNAGVIGELQLPAAPLAEQTQIAKFLEHETVKIDRLISQQQALIALLKEKRQAVISHAVTKGLNPHAPLADSGVEWLGQVPAHWTLKNYRYAARIYRGKFGHRPRNDPAFYDGKYPFIQTGDISRAEKNITSYSQTLNERGVAVSQKFPAGTLVMAIAANIGDTAILEFEAYAPDSVVGFKPTEDVDLEFLRYSLMAALPALEQTSTQSTQANLNIDRIGSVKAAFPPIPEQRTIVLRIESLVQSFGVIEKEAVTAIELMQERRTALISAAVTGKIDVRDWQPPEPAATAT